MYATQNIPLIGDTSDVKSDDGMEYWRHVFGGIWGPVDLTEIGGGRISGRLRSRKIGELNFNRIDFGHQIFRCINDNAHRRDEPFYSLTFPQSGTAKCHVGEDSMRLVPKHAYLVNVRYSARLDVEASYSTFNIQIPVSALEHRLGRMVNILPRNVLRPDTIYHLMEHLISELALNEERLDSATSGFLTNQMLDTVAFFLTAGNSESDETLAVRCVRARVLAFLDENYHDPTLNPSAVSRECGISRSYLYKVFSQGPSVMEHLRRRRLEAARHMLEIQAGKLPMTSVAMSCGFSSSSEFSRLFKSRFGLSPSKI